MDDDLESMSREDLIAEVKKLRAGVRAHRESSEHDLCWHHPALWSLLPEKSDPLPVVPEWPQFMRGCIRYRQSLDEQGRGLMRTKKEYGGHLGIQRRGFKRRMARASIFPPQHPVSCDLPSGERKGSGAGSQRDSP